MSPITELNQNRIASDMSIAIDCLYGVISCARDGQLHPNYLKEKLDTAKRCIAFAEHFVDKE